MKDRSNRALPLPCLHFRKMTILGESIPSCDVTHPIRHTNAENQDTIVSRTGRQRTFI